ncbi:hypothetical protein [Nonomuraea helvata]|uniref:Lipoprotein n=1 Tax=Nonomuraea helvata TaxID=37484 RepID=A0ABV5SDD9_9ACTN
MTIKRPLCLLLVLPVTAACGLVGQGATGGPSTPFPSGQKRGAVTSASPQEAETVTAAEAKQILARWDRAEKEAMRQGGTDAGRMAHGGRLRDFGQAPHAGT